jgi:hypothetical protein
MDIGMKVDRRTDFRTWFYGGDGHQNITTVRTWINRAQKHRSLLSHRRKEAVVSCPKGLLPLIFLGLECERRTVQHGIGLSCFWCIWAWCVSHGHGVRESA